MSVVKFNDFYRRTLSKLIRAPAVVGVFPGLASSSDSSEFHHVSSHPPRTKLPTLENCYSVPWLRRGSSWSWKRVVCSAKLYLQDLSSNPSGNSDKKNDQEQGQKDDPPKQPNPDDEEANRVNVLLGFLLTLLLAYKMVLPKTRETSFSIFLQQILPTGEVKELKVNSQRNRVEVILHRGAEVHGLQERGRGMLPDLNFTISSVEKFEQKLIDAQDELGIPPSGRVPIVYNTKQSNTMLDDLAELLFYFLVWYIVLRRTSGASKTTRSRNPISAFTGANPTIITEYNRHSIKFKNVAGMREAKNEVMEFVDYLKNPKRYTSLGARIPKGALLHGPPGTGKTMLARAIAAEANVPFISMSGTDFIERIGGVGASRMRDLFNQARQLAPCILYIDEIDTIGKSRSQGGYSNTEQENTLNQLLVEMDGIDPLVNVVVMASTNRKSILDAALVRPGRFDRQVEITLPTLLERKEIFEEYLRTIVLDDKNKLEKYASQLAALTPDHSGADISNIVNEAAIIAVRSKQLSVTETELHKAIERVIAGLERKTHVMTPEERRVVAYHEAGHALAGWLLEHTDPVLKVSIVPRVKGTLGYSQRLPTDQKLYTTEQILDRMCMTLGGRAAEALTFKKITTSAQDDLKKVTKMAYRQVSEFGMNPRIGHISLPLRGSEPYSKTMYSQKLTKMIDEEVRRTVNEAYERVETLLIENTSTLTKLAEALLEKEVLNYEDIVSIAGEMPYEKKQAQLPSEIKDHR